MSENAAILLGALYEAYLKGRNLDVVKATEIGLSKKAIVEAGNELKADGYLPNFTYTETRNSEPIWFIGTLSETAIALCEAN